MALTGKRIFITGGAGFIGTTLAKRLVDANEVIAADNLHRDALSGTALADHPNFSFHELDVLDADAMRELAVGATHIVHCAAIAGVATVLESPVRTMRVNVIGTYNMLEAAVGTLDTLERFVDFSTSEVFGTHAFRVQEGQVSTIGSVGEARWTYAVSKLAGEHMAHAYHDELGLPTVTVHPFNVFGPGQIGGGAIRAFIQAALAQRDLTIHGDGSQIRAWCYVDDMVDGTLLVLERPEAVGQAFNIGNNRSTVTIYDLAQRVNRIPGTPGRSCSSRSTTPTSSCASRTSTRHASCSAMRPRSSSTRVWSARSSGTAVSRPDHGWNRLRRFAPGRGAERRGHSVTALGRADGDLADPGVADLLLATHAPDVVVHLAALVGRVVGEAEPLETTRQNVDVTAFVAAACAAHGARLLYGSTTEVYGPVGDRVVTEETPLDTVADSAYGRSKRAGEEAALRFVPDAALLRLSMPYGPGTAPGRGRGAIVNMLDQAVRGEPIRVYRGDERSWCWVGDIARAIALLIERGERGAWNIGRDDDRRSMLEVAQLVCRVTGANEELIDEVDAPTAPAAGHVSTAKLRAAGWKPEVEFEDGLRRTLVSMAPR